jgi:hypothetical protein
LVEQPMLRSVETMAGNLPAYSLVAINHIKAKKL